MSYDQKCYDLAEVFLSDIQNPVSKDDAHKLAQEIQTTIEDYLDALERSAHGVPSALDDEAERSLKVAISHAKVWDSFFDNLLNPRKEPS